MINHGYVSAPLIYISLTSWWIASSFSSFSYRRQFNTHSTESSSSVLGAFQCPSSSSTVKRQWDSAVCLTLQLCFSNNVCSQTPGGPGTRGTGFPQLSAGTMPDELGPLTTSSNDTPFQEVLPVSLESPDLTATGYVRAPVAPEIQANLRGVGIIPTSSGFESLDQDSMIIIPGVEPPSPSRWKCDPHADTLPMSHTPQPQVQSRMRECLHRILHLPHLHHHDIKDRKLLHM